MLLERIVSTPDNVYVGATREEALAMAVLQEGRLSSRIPRIGMWPTLQRYANDNAEFVAYNPARQNPEYVWAEQTASSQIVGLAAASGAYAFTQYEIHIAVFADNAHQLQIDLIDANTGTAVSANPLGTLLLDGEMNPSAGTTVEQPEYPYNWQNIRFYSISSPVVPPGSYRIAISMLAVNYDQYDYVSTNPAGISFVADISTPFPSAAIFNADQGTFFPTLEGAVLDAVAGDTLLVGPGNHSVADTLALDKPLSIRGFSSGALPVVAFQPTSNPSGLIIRADDITLETLHLIGYPAASALNAVFTVELRTIDNPYNRFTMRSCIVEGANRSGYIWAQNLTIDDSQFLLESTSQSLRLQEVRGTTRITNNTFQGRPGNVGAIVFEPNIASYTSSGDIRISGNTMRSFNQFVNFFPHLAGPTSLIIEGNDVDHETNDGSSIILFSRVNYGLMTQLLIRNNRIRNLAEQRLAVYYARSGDGSFIPAPGQVQVYDNTFDFYPPPFGRATDTVFTNPPLPVGYAANPPQGMSLAAFDAEGNIVLTSG